MTGGPITIAAAGYAPEWHDSWGAMAAKLDAWVADAAGQGADLLVFPEYGGLEAALIGRPAAPGTAEGWAMRMAERAEDWAALHLDLAARHGVHILAGSLAADGPRGRVNRSWLVTPKGIAGCQDKMILVPWERRPMGLVPGETLNLFETALGRIGVLICYDSEFPLLARALVEAGAEMLLVPSCTDLPAGQTRVRQSCRARAIEGQCLVVQAPMMGRLDGCEASEIATGRAGFFGPPDLGQPPDGILAQGETDVPGWTLATLDPGAIAAPREGGQVGNVAHWVEQDTRLAQVVRVRAR